jgi:hypothetical protein
MSKEAMRAESERLVKEAMARKITVTQGKTRLEVKCSKCGAPNRVMAEPGETRVEYKCKECGHEQRTLSIVGWAIGAFTPVFDGPWPCLCAVPTMAAEAHGDQMVGTLASQALPTLRSRSRHHGRQRKSEFADFHLAKLHDAAAGLQRNRA